LKQYTLFAGVNGAGKTSLYHAESVNIDAIGARVNLDEIVRASGDWHDTHLQLQAGKQAISLIQKYIAEGVSFHQETTLAGRTILKTVRQAKAAGFRIVLYYVGVESPEIAKQRVHRRVEKGGHGVADEVIESRYEKSLRNLKIVAPLCDIVNIYDNSGDLPRYVMAVKDQQVLWQAEQLPRWLVEAW
jgi:predicted ABC-type ATPase